ncbi:MAG TPA: hypothetical protein VKU19_22530 [Bryobacteraceae bacterium]|nr:hypothetical protein [Bryobacteraceae bacterium]
MAAKDTWTFKARLRVRAFGWRGSHLACQRLKEAVTEIKQVARKDPVTAGDGVVSLMERIWPAFQDVDTSSGALCSAVYWAQDELLPIAIKSPADRKTRDKWLERLWQAIEDDGVDYLSLVRDRWGELCGSREVASFWADQFLGLLRTAWSDPRPGKYLRGSSVCLSSLLAAGRHQELLEVLALQRYPFWHHRKFGMQALESEGRMDEALAYAEASRGLNQPDAAINAECERVLLDLGRVDEAYEKYALAAKGSPTTGLATFRAIVKKYPGRDPRKILLDLATSSGEPGRWFAAAKDARFLDLALEFANTGRTDPRTLSRASRDLLKEDAQFCLEVGRLAIQRMLEGYGYELTGMDVIDAYNHFMVAAQTLGIASQARGDVLVMAAKQPGALSDILIRQCSVGAHAGGAPANATISVQRTWTKRSPTRH